MGDRLVVHLKKVNILDEDCVELRDVNDNIIMGGCIFLGALDKIDGFIEGLKFSGYDVVLESVVGRLSTEEEV
ncbi:hypothetical protein Q7A53_05905 [Halobacillus rhizosphaerae]|uniref:hypothetical protein n=1 Tax=Halobacillus rhizosphaerae TaxID=3064889 RepID=UPI00398AB9B4